MTRISTATRIPSPPRRVAVDTGALLALAAPRDQYHDRARTIADRLAKAGTRFVGHTLVLGELHGHLIRHLDAEVSRRLVSGVLRDPLFEWTAVTPELVSAAMSGWVERFKDQRFSLTDAITFEVMRTERLTHAFAFDRDFTTAGYALV
jgi:predicted nucleic acid-binding protein